MRYAALGLIVLACGRTVESGESAPLDSGPGDTGIDGTADARAACDDDSFDNHEQHTASDLVGPAELEGLMACPERDDWFRIDGTNATSFSVAACFATDGPSLTFAGFREEFDELYRLLNCGSSGSGESCVSTCSIDSPGVYYFRVGAEGERVPYRLDVHFEEDTSNVTRTPPDFDQAPLLLPNTPTPLTVCTDSAKYHRIEIPAAALVSIESFADNAGFYLDFTLTDEADAHLDYWPQGAGRTLRELELEAGRYMLRLRSTVSGCRSTTLSYEYQARE